MNSYLACILSMSILRRAIVTSMQPLLHYEAFAT